MKRFLLYVLILIGLLFVGFTTYYFIATDEKFELSVAESQAIKLNVGDRFTLDQIIEYNKDDLAKKVEVNITNSTILGYSAERGEFTALAAGDTALKITPENQRFGPYSFIVKVGDVSRYFPPSI